MLQIFYFFCRIIFALLAGSDFSKWGNLWLHKYKQIFVYIDEIASPSTPAVQYVQYCGSMSPK